MVFELFFYCVTVQTKNSCKAKAVFAPKKLQMAPVFYLHDMYFISKTFIYTFFTLALFYIYILMFPAKTFLSILF